MTDTYTILWRRGTAAAWTSANTVLSQGEPGLETDTGKHKVGDGTTAWNSLIYADTEAVMSFTRPGNLAVETGAARLYFPDARTIKSVTATVNTAPTGAAVIVDVLKNGSTVFTTTANRPTVAISGHTSSAEVPDVTSLAAGDFLTLNIAQVGSSVTGADLTVAVLVQ